MIIIEYNLIEEMNIELKKLKGKTELKLKRTISSFYDERNYLRQSGIFLFEEDLFSKNAQSGAVILHEAMFLTKFLQTKPEIEERHKFLSIVLFYHFELSKRRRKMRFHKNHVKLFARNKWMVFYLTKLN